MKPKGIPKETLTSDNIRRDLRRKLWKSLLWLALAVLLLVALVYLIAANPVFLISTVPGRQGRFDLPGWVYAVAIPAVLGFTVWQTWLVICGFRHKLYVVKDVLISSEFEKGIRPRTWTPYTDCTLHFSGYGDYEVPEKNYPWSKEYPMTAEGVYHTSMDGDAFYLVLTKPHSGKILLAYPAKYFTLEE